VIRGDDEKLRGFKNVCRHRASRLFESNGHCERNIVCPYHGWTYQLDGRLRGMPSSENFPDVNKSELGLHEIQLEIFHGLVFVRVHGGGHGLVESFAQTSTFFADHQVEKYVEVAEPSVEIWDVNWKVAMDNYMENYHIPIGHPGLRRMLQEQNETIELSSGINLGVFGLREKLSSVAEERQYQQQLHRADDRLPDTLKSKWVQLGISPNHGIDLYPEMLDVFQLNPLGLDRTEVTTSYYGLKDQGEDIEALRRLNLVINQQVNAEDLTLCRRVQQGLATPGYQPGPLSTDESSVHHFHDMIRDLVPVAGLPERPLDESVTWVNQRMSDDASRS
jgi:phenylpropionate dioxygenase-like ring-hydroxylating dioxygenase large terminal subunit